MDSIEKITQKLIQFRDERDWSQFHDPKNLALALSIEVAELNEIFLWKDSKDSHNVDQTKVKEELADVLAYAFLLAEKFDLNIEEIMLKKIQLNAQKYPVEKSQGRSTKYNQL